MASKQFVHFLLRATSGTDFHVNSMYVNKTMYGYLHGIIRPCVSTQNRSG